MRPLSRLLVLVAWAIGALAVAAPATAGHENDPRQNLRPLGHIVEHAVLGGFGGANPDINTDITFWGDLAIQGNWDGFSIRDISDPHNPTTISRAFCDGNQGDVSVWGNIVVRSWNTPAGDPGPFGAGLTCGGEDVEVGFEGLHIFDISDLSNPVLVGEVELECGSHTNTLVPDLANGRLIVYSNVSSGCDWIDVVEVPLANPAGASLLRTEPLEGPLNPAVTPGCHDMTVILGDAMLAVCAAADATNVFSVGGALGGSLEDPEFLYLITEPGVDGLAGRWHSSAFTWDGKVIVLGWEPGGGVAAECEAGDDPVK